MTGWRPGAPPGRRTSPDPGPEGWPVSGPSSHPRSLSAVPRGCLAASLPPARFLVRLMPPPQGRAQGRYGAPPTALVSRAGRLHPGLSGTDNRAKLQTRRVSAGSTDRVSRCRVAVRAGRQTGRCRWGEAETTNDRRDDRGGCCPFRRVLSTYLAVSPFASRACPSPSLLRLPTRAREGYTRGGAARTGRRKPGTPQPGPPRRSFLSCGAPVGGARICPTGENPMTTPLPKTF